MLWRIFFFENEARKTYRNIVTRFFVLQLEIIALEDKWFQRDGATWYAAFETMAVLHESFPGRAHSRILWL